MGARYLTASMANSSGSISSSSKRALEMTILLLAVLKA